VTLSAVLTTHKHADHSGGNEAVKAMFPGLRVYGGAIDSVPGVTHNLDDGDEFTIGSIKIKTYHAPCHTKGRILLDYALHA